MTSEKESRSRTTKLTVENEEIYEEVDLTLVDYIGANYPRGKKAKKVFDKQPAMSDAKIKDYMTRDP